MAPYRSRCPPCHGAQQHRTVWATNSGNDGENNSISGSGIDTGTGADIATGTDTDTEKEVIHVKELMSSLRSSLSADEGWAVLNMRRVLHGFHADAQYRLRLVTLRMQCFFMVVHSKMPGSCVDAHVKTGAVFLRDLLQLSDRTSEAAVQLTQALLSSAGSSIVACSSSSGSVSGGSSPATPLQLAYLALENLLGLLESRLRRRSSFVVNTNILQLLGLTRGGADRDAARGGGASSGGLTDDPWSSIVLTCCSFAPRLHGWTSAFASTPTIAHASATSAVDSDGAGEGGSTGGQAYRGMANTALAEKLAEINATGRYIRIGLELYALSVTTRDSSHVVADMPLVGSIVGLIQAGTADLTAILRAIRQEELQQQEWKRQWHASSSSSPVSAPAPVLSPVQRAYRVHAMLLVSKALYCLELTIERSGYLTAYRESDGPAAVSSLIETFTTFDTEDDADTTPSSASVSSTTPLVLDSFGRNILESALTVLHLAIQKSRQAVLTQGNNADAGLRVAHQPFFSVLCSKALASPFHKNEVLWRLLLELVKVVVDLDPPYLAHFLQSPAAQQLSAALQFGPRGQFPRRFVDVTTDPGKNTAIEDDDNDNDEGGSIGKGGEGKKMLCTDLEQVLLPIARLAYSVCITEEGKQYLASTGMVRFVIEAMLQPSLLLPCSGGVYAEQVAKVGKMLTHVLLDCDSLRGRTKDLLREKLLALSREAKDVWTNGSSSSSGSGGQCDGYANGMLEDSDNELGLETYAGAAAAQPLVHAD